MIFIFSNSEAYAGSALPESAGKELSYIVLSSWLFNCFDNYARFMESPGNDSALVNTQGCTGIFEKLPVMFELPAGPASVTEKFPLKRLLVFAVIVSVPLMPS